MAIIFILLLLFICLLKDIFINSMQTKHKKDKKNENSINFDNLDKLADFVEEFEIDEE